MVNLIRLFCSIPPKYGSAFMFSHVFIICWVFSQFCHSFITISQSCTKNCLVKNQQIFASFWLKFISSVILAPKVELVAFHPFFSCTIRVFENGQKNMPRHFWLLKSKYCLANKARSIWMFPQLIISYFLCRIVWKKARLYSER